MTLLYYDIPTLIRDKIMANLQEYDRRVYIVVDLDALLKLMKGDSPAVGIIPEPFTTPYLKGSNEMEYTFTVYVIHKIFEEDAVLIGGAGEKGIMELASDLFILLRNERFITETDALGLNCIDDTSIIKSVGPGAARIGKSQQSLYFAAMGLQIRYQEVVLNG